MGENSKISWTDHTFNPWIGCTKVSPDCAHCYAERDMDHRFGKAKWGPSGTRVMTSEAYWKKPLQWNKQAEKEGVRKRVFCASLADVFEDWKGGRDEDGVMTCPKTGEELHINDDGHVWPISWPSMSDGDDWGVRTYTMNDARIKLFRLIYDTPNLDWLLLTKRPENIQAMWPALGLPDHGVPGTLGRRLYLKNVWLGTSVENQEQAYKRIPELLKCRGLSPVLFLSCEPLLGRVDVTGFLPCHCKVNLKPGWSHAHSIKPHDGVWQVCPDCNGYPYKAGTIDWVIAGGESGTQARPMHPDWARSLRDQCKAAKVPFHFKQWGEWLPFYDRDKDDPDWQNLPQVSDNVTRINLAGGRGFHGDRLVYLKRLGHSYPELQTTLDGITHQEFPTLKD